MGSGETVYVKLIRDGSKSNRLLFSMSAVDQDTGKDLVGEESRQSDLKGTSTRALFGRDGNGDNGSGRGTKRPAEDDNDGSTWRRRKRKHMLGGGDQNMWERTRLRQSGVCRDEYFDEDEDNAIYDADEDSDHIEDLEIDIREDEPEFLKGQTYITQDLDSVKVVKNPDGSLNH